MFIIIYLFYILDLVFNIVLLLLFLYLYLYYI